MPFLENLENSFPDSWPRQRPKGYESSIEIARNDGLALRMFQEYCCDSCSCRSENDHKKESN